MPGCSLGASADVASADVVSGGVVSGVVVSGVVVAGMVGPCVAVVSGVTLLSSTATDGVALAACLRVRAVQVS
jgi:hypothetical protein